MSFYVYPGSSSMVDGYFRVTDGVDTVVFFFTNSTSEFYMNGTLYNTFLYSANTWYHIEVTNMNWTSRTFDFYVNGSLIDSGISFGSTNPSYVNTVYLYNFHYDTYAYWDDIQIEFNEASTDITLSSTSIAENQPISSTIGTFSTTDPDSGEPFTYTLVSGTGSTDNASFSIYSSTLKTASVFNYESQSSYSIRVSTTDSGGATYEKVFTITINDLNEPLQIGSIADQTTLEDISTSIISLTATDAETATSSLIITMTSSNQTLIPDEYLLSLSNADGFSIVATPALNQYGTATISVTITDAGGLTACTSFNLTVTDVDDSQYTWENFIEADVVLGQPDFTSNASGTTDNIFNSPHNIAVDPTTGKIFVCDTSNNRILRFSATNAAINGASAEAVLGQANFTSGSVNRGGSVAANTLNAPIDNFVDVFGRLWVCDHANYRVLRFDNASSISSGADANFVLGQPDFTTNSGATSINKMNRPVGIWYDPAGRLWVSEYDNSRVLRFDCVDSKSNGADADGVLGQTSFTTASTSTTQSLMKSTFSVFGDTSGSIYITDYSNNRILRFDNAALKANGADADGVLGQPDYTSNGAIVSQTGMDTAISAKLDDKGRLYVSEADSNRIVIFNDANNKANGAAADYVLGQPDFTSNTINNGGISAKTINSPRHLFFDPDNNHLWVADKSNHRVLRYRMMITETPPEMGLISDATMDEDTISNAISFIVTDINEQALTITYTSSDTSLISTSGITFSGDQVFSNGGVYTVTTSSDATSVTLSITPESNQSGTCSITITVTDPDGMTATDSFSLTINAVEDAPYLAAIESQVLANSPITFTITDDDGGSVEVTASSSDSSILTSGGINIAGSGSNTYSFTSTANVPTVLTMAFNSVAGQYGLVTITCSVIGPTGITETTTFPVFISPPGPGMALEFDGVDDYVDLGSISGSNPLALSGSELTISFWLKPELTGDSAQRIIDKSTDSYGQDGYGCSITTSGQVAFYTNDYTRLLTTTGVIQANTWQHIAITGDGTTYTCYVNGIAAPATYPNAYGYPATTTANAKIGAVSNMSRQYHGQLDELCIWNRALSQSEVRQKMCQKLNGSENGLVAYFRFDENSGAILTDLTGNGNHGTLTTNMSDSNWITSAAAIGDTSAFDYEGSNASDFIVNLSHANGDSFTAVGDGGTYTSLHIYLVNEAPNVTSMPGSFQTMDTSHYYGVFPVGNSATYSLTYYYGQNTYTNENEVLLGFRANNADTDWSSLLTIINTNTKELSCSNISTSYGYSASEFIFGTEPINLMPDDLIAYYPFNGNANDESGNGYDGTPIGARSVVDRNGVSDAAYQLDGVSDWIRLQDFNVPETFSVSLWLNIQEIAFQGYVGKHDSSGNNIFVLGYYYGIQIRIHDAFINFGTPTTGYHLITSVVEKIDASTSKVTLYLDQSILYQQTYNATIGSDTTGLEWTIGQEWDAGPTYSDFFKGIFDEVTFYNRALNSSEVRYLYNLTPVISTIETPSSVSDVVTLTLTTAESSQLTFIARSSDQTILPDSQINLNASGSNEILVNTTASTPVILTLTMTPVSNMYGRVLITCSVIGTTGITETSNFPVIVSPPGPGMALEFDGIDDYIDLGSVSGSDPLGLSGSELTISFWVKPELTGNTFQRIIDKSTDLYGQDGYACLIKTGGGVEFSTNGHTRLMTSDGLLQANIWQHIAVTGDGTTYTCYVNGIGVPATYPNAYGYPPASAANTKIGAISNYSRQYNGQLDELRIWNRALSQSEIRQNMCQKLNGNENGLMAYFQFDHDSGTILSDLSGNGNHGSLTTTMSDSNWITSGAAIGDTSVFDYAGTNASDFLVNLSHANGDSFTAVGDGGTYTGIHVYLVNEAPNVTSMPGSFQTMDTSHYYGVFPVGYSPTYSLTYYYGQNTYTNENEVLLGFRANNADMDWSSLLTILNTDTNELSCSNISVSYGYSASEFIFGTEPINLMPDDLIAYYPFNGNANDESGNGYDGTPIGARSVVDRNGVSDAAYQLDGVSDWIRLQDFNVPETFSVSLWLNIQEIAFQGYVGKHDSSGNNIFVLGYYYGIQSRIHDAFINFGTPTTGYHLITSVVEKIDASTSKVTLYLDQSILYQQTYNATIGSDISGLEWTIGQEWDAGPTYSDFFKGIFDEVTFYNRALNSSEVRYLYNLTPVISTIETPSSVSDVVTLTLTTAESSQLTFIARSSDQTILPDSQINLNASGSNEILVNTTASTPLNLTLTMTPVSNTYGRVLITCSVIGPTGITETTNFPVIISPPGPGMALEFDGVDDYIDFGNISGSDPLALSGSEFTISFWVKPKLTGDSYQRIIDKSTGNNAQDGYAVSVYKNGRVGLFINNAIRLETSIDLVQADIWQHIAVTGNGTTYTCYYNGVGVPATYPDVYDYPATTSGDTRIGGASFDSRLYRGQLDELRIWNKALSQSEIRQYMCQKLNGNENGLIAYFPFDQSSGSILTDLTGNGNHGSLTTTMSDSNWITSGAAIGDTSVFDYAGTNASDFIVNLSHANGDSLTATGDGGTYSGIHLFIVNEAPNITSNTTGYNINNYYWGVFPVGTTPTYEILYDYDGNSGYPSNITTDLLNRYNNSDNTWTGGQAVQNSNEKTITQSAISAFSGVSKTEFWLIYNNNPLTGSISDQTMNEDTAIMSLSLTTTDSETADCNMEITFASSNTSIVAIENISYTCDSGTYYISLSPTTNQSGNVNITITITDSGNVTATEAFALTVNDINDAPVIGTISDQTTLENIATSVISVAATDVETSTSSLILTMTSSNQTLIPDKYLLYLSNAGGYSIVATPALNQYGTATISVTITDSGGLSTSTSFNLTVTEVD
ncbi:Cadherin domain protein, partial [Candidatus Magnetomorum sp. HK-1]